MDIRRFARVEEGRVVAYPLSLRAIQLAHPNISFPLDVADEGLLDYGYAVVIPTAKPRPTIDAVPVEGDPECLGGYWRQSWELRPTGPHEKEAFIAAVSADVRQKRDKLLAETDWWAVQDRTMIQAERDYRQALRDITDHVNFPHLTEGDWPTKP